MGQGGPAWALPPPGPHVPNPEEPLGGVGGRRAKMERNEVSQNRSLQRRLKRMQGAKVLFYRALGHALRPRPHMAAMALPQPAPCLRASAGDSPATARSLLQGFGTSRGRRLLAPCLRDFGPNLRRRPTTAPLAPAEPGHTYKV